MFLGSAANLAHSYNNKQTRVAPFKLYTRKDSSHARGFSCLAKVPPHGPSKQHSRMQRSKFQCLRMFSDTVYCLIPLLFYKIGQNSPSHTKFFSNLVSFLWSFPLCFTVPSIKITPLLQRKLYCSLFWGFPFACVRKSPKINRVSIQTLSIHLLMTFLLVL